MKLSDLRQSILDMNDGEEPDYETSIVTAANLALNHLTRVIPPVGRVTVEQRAPLFARLLPAGDVEYNAVGVGGISFEALGAGSVEVNGAVVRSWSGFLSYTPVRFIPPSDEVSLKFVGITGAVSNLGFFDRVSDVTQIPIVGEYVAYDMNTLTNDYISFLSSPSREGGSAVEGCVYRAHELLVPSSERGRITIPYKRKPRKITLDSVVNDAEIDVDRECEDLLELLTMYYILAADAGGESLRKAAMYLNQFNTMAALASTQRRRGRNDGVYTRYGW